MFAYIIIKSLHEIQTRHDTEATHTTNMQLTAVIIILLLSVCYAGWRFWQSLSSKTDPCAGCSGCALKNGNNSKNGKDACDKKKNIEKFGRKKKKH